MKYIIDRIENDVAVLEDEAGRHIRVPVLRLPQGVRDGTCLTEADGVFTADPAREELRRLQLARRVRRLLHRRRG